MAVNFGKLSRTPTTSELRIAIQECREIVGGSATVKIKSMTMIAWDDFLLDTRIQTTTLPSGLVNGPYGLWLLENYKFKNGSSDLIYDLLRKKMNKMTRLFNDSSDFSYNLGYGLVGFLWTMKCIIPDRDIYDKIILKDSLLPLIEDECMNMLEQGNFGLLTGAHGLLMYLLSLDALRPGLYQEYVEASDDMMDQDLEGYAPRDQYDDSYPSNGIFDGITENALILARMYKYKPSTEARKILQKMVPFLIDFVVDQSRQIGNSNRLVSLGEFFDHLSKGYTLIKIGLVLQNPNYIKEGLHTLESCRELPHGELINLSIISGISLIAYIFHRLGSEIPRMGFEQLSNQWVQLMEQQWKHSVTDRLHDRPWDTVPITSLTHGFAGPRLAYLTMKGQVTGQWDEWLLL